MGSGQPEIKCNVDGADFLYSPRDVLSISLARWDGQNKEVHLRRGKVCLLGRRGGLEERGSEMGMRSLAR